MLPSQQLYVPKRTFLYVQPMLTKFRIHLLFQLGLFKPHKSSSSSTEYWRPTSRLQSVWKLINTHMLEFLQRLLKESGSSREIRLFYWKMPKNGKNFLTFVINYWREHSQLLRGKWLMLEAVTGRYGKHTSRRRLNSKPKSKSKQRL
jgi:hypothetical protein